jgi:hypothetical protein
MVVYELHLNNINAAHAEAGTYCYCGVGIRAIVDGKPMRRNRPTG